MVKAEAIKCGRQLSGFLRFQQIGRHPLGGVIKCRAAEGGRVVIEGWQVHQSR